MLMRNNRGNSVLNLRVTAILISMKMQYEIVICNLENQIM